MTIAIAAITLCGCPKLDGACDSDADCKAGEFCDTASKACFAKDGGEDGGTDGGMDGGSCPSGCEAWEECAGDVCAPRYSGVAITEPASGNQTAGATVTVKAVLTLADGRTASAPDALTLEVTEPGSDTPATHPLAKSGEEYVGTFTLGTAEGAYQLVAKYADAELASPKVTLTVDATAPTFEIEVTPAAARPAAMDGTTYGDPDSAYQTAYRRDEVIEVHVSSTAEDVDPASVKLGAQFGNGAAASAFDVMPADSSECGSAAYCGKVMLNAWEPEMKEFRDTLALTADGKDGAGNASEEATGAVKVTRWKWVHQVDTNPVKASPAIASDGTVIVGSTNTSTTGKLQAIRPDGTLRWEKTNLGAIESTPAIGDLDGGVEPIYVGSNLVGGARLTALDLNSTNGNSDAGVLGTCGPFAGGFASGAPATFHPPVDNEAALEAAAFVVDASPNVRLVAIRPGGQESISACVSTATTGATKSLSGVAIQGLDAYFTYNYFVSVQVGTVGELGSYRFSSAATWNSRPSWPVDIDQDSHSLAITNTDVIGGGVPGGGGIYAAPLAGGTTWYSSISAKTWNPAVGPGDKVYIGDDSANMSVLPVGGNSPGVVGTEGVVRGAPLVGEGGWVYATSSGGYVTARNANTLDQAWTLGSLGTLEASPNIDCTRDPATGNPLSGRPGVLYVGSNDGNLYAFIVDSHGIETSAGTAWPKYQHDPRNTGNADTDLSEFECQ